MPPISTSSAVPKWPSAPERAVGDQLAGGHRVAAGIEFVGAQERLMRGMGGVGLVLVNERSCRVLRS